VKRSHRIQLLLAGGLSLGGLTACAPSSAGVVRITPEAVYANNYHLPGVGYYHAPFHAFYDRPYNDYDDVRKMYFYGGQWAAAPHRSVINLSAPTAQAAQLAETMRSDIQRGGFGGTSGFHGVYS
jgi:hypothetical protein